MLEYLQAVSLLGLIIGHYFLIRGCFSIREIIGSKSGSISEAIDKNSGLLDELIQVVVDVVPEGPSSSGIVPAGSPWGDILNSFLTRANTPEIHGESKTQNEWEVLPNQDDTTTQEATHQG